MSNLPEGFVWEDDGKQTTAPLPDGFKWEEDPKVPLPNGTQYPEIKENKPQESSRFSRFVDAASEGFNKGFGKKPVFDEVPTEYFPPSYAPAVTNAYNHIANTLIDSGEGVLRGIGGLVRAGTHTIAQAAQEMGMSEGEASRLERDLVGMLDASGMASAGFNLAGNSSRTINKVARQAERSKDIKAYDKLGVQPFAPTLTETPTLGTTAHIAEKVPLAGSPVRVAANDTVTELANSARKIADDLSPSKIEGLEEGGEIIQKGIKRFGSEKTLSRPIEELPDNELRNIIVNSSSSSLSFTTKQEAMYESAWRRLPARFKTNGSKNPDLVATTNSRRILQNIEKRQAQIGVSGGALQGKFSGMAEKLRSRGGLTIETMRRMRTEVGRMLGRGPDDNVNMDRQQLKELYSGLTDDITGGLTKIAQRSAKDTNVPTTVTKKAFDAVRAFKRADQFTKNGIERLDKLLRVSNAATPEKAAEALMKAALSSGQGNLSLLRAAKRTLRQEEWNDISSLVLKRLGMPKPGVKGINQDLGFSPTTFSTEWNKLTPQGKAIIFGGNGKHVKEAVEALARVSSKVSNFEGMANHSNSLSHAVTAASSLGVFGSVTGYLPQALAFMGGTYGYSKMISSPAFARWYAKAVKISENPGRSRQWAAHLAQLQLLANKDPELLPILQELE